MDNSHDATRQLRLTRAPRCAAPRAGQLSVGSGGRRGWSAVALWPVLLGLGVMLGGCEGDSPPPPVEVLDNPDQPASAVGRIVAQGQLLPAGGIVRISATPGDIVEAILVAPGDRVSVGQPIIELRSARLRQSQLAALQRQLTEAEVQHRAAIARAEADVTVATLELEQAREQAAALARREETLALARQQVADAEETLARAEAIGADPLTRGMVGRLEIDRQRAAVNSARLQFAQQQEALLSAREAAVFAQRAAQEKLAGARRALELAEASNPVAVIESQISTAQEQLEASRLTAPAEGVVVSIDARVGEAATQFPLMQLADLSRMVCRVEVYQADAPRLAVGQAAMIRNNALPRALRGRVSRIDRLVGNPQLRGTDPLARVDFRTLAAYIDIQSEDAAIAAEWLQLQVEVEIETGGVTQRILGGLPATSP
jgi:ABC exporter DevB family membrane fusion protein